MSEMSGEGGQGLETGGNNPSVADSSGGQENQGGGSGLNPAWNDLMQVIPSQLHSQVTPHLSQWDRNYQDGINKVHSQYEGYKPFIENEIPPEQINYALQIAMALDQNPDQFFRALGEAQGVDLSFLDEQGQNDNQGEGGQGGEGEAPDFVNHPEFQKIQQMVDLMAQTLVQQNQSAQDAQEDELLNADLDAAHEEFGDFDEEWVLTKVFNAINRGEDMTIQQAAQEYQNFTQGILQNARKPGPKVLGAGGQVPNQQFDPKNASDSDRRAMIANMLSAAHQNG